MTPPTAPDGRGDRVRRGSRGSRARSRSRSTDRGVSTALGYVLTLSITVVLISGLLVAAGGFVSDERERVTETELDVVGNRLAAGVESVDRIGAAPGESRVEATVRLPPRVAGTTYSIEVVSGSPNELVLTSTDPEVTVRVPVSTETSLTASRVDGGDVTITYDPSSGLEVNS
ncbi:hypothetical protein DEQ92_02915 [Haloferax sp. Atlit-6N]|uniref:DUF7266 family protein n=1 Tax=unclassified Haloferax TaxID=2625095 RepID=UPI000E278B2C|nr:MULTISPECIES: hypothetical protein [unclassified Haloferax]RDZ55111.1 hypothetical protein C5C07_06220 [Haloferax sp. Atlit-4N]REA05247.1 hypothetical protein DEQ92_02915 [Haloferax sp. Atlit-6N]